MCQGFFGHGQSVGSHPGSDHFPGDAEESGGLAEISLTATEGFLDEGFFDRGQVEFSSGCARLLFLQTADYPALSTDWPKLWAKIRKSANPISWSPSRSNFKS